MNARPDIDAIDPRWKFMHAVRLASIEAPAAPEPLGDSLADRIRRRLRALGRDIASTVRYARRVMDTPPARRVAYPLHRLLKAPICWARRHTWARQGSIAITNYTLQYCECCGEEIAGRTSFDDIIASPDDAADDHWHWDAIP